jgi:hypothetical protein
MAKLIHHDPHIRVQQPKTLTVHLPTDIRPFEYKKIGARPDEGAFERPTGPPEEMLTGFVHGKKASDLEERFAKALDFFGIEYIFQFEVQSAYSLPNEGKQIDFIVFDGGIGIPVEIGASFVHSGPSEQEMERLRQGIVNPILELMGIQRLGDPRYEVPFDRPYDFEDAKDIVAGMFISA